MTAKTQRQPEGYDSNVDFAVLGRAFREERERRGWSRARLSELSGIPTSTLQQVEGGGNSELRTLVRLADALDLSLSDVIAHATTGEKANPTVTRLMHNAPSALGGVDASARAGLSDLQLLQRIAIAILHMVGAPELPRPDRPSDPDESETR